MQKLAVFFAKLKLVLKKVTVVENAIAQLLLELIIVGHTKLKKKNIDRKSLSLVPKVAAVDHLSITYFSQLIINHNFSLMVLFHFKH